MTFAFPLPSVFWFPIPIFLKIAPPKQSFRNFVSPLQKWGWDWEGVENYVYVFI